MDNQQTSVAQMMEIANCSENVAVDYLSRTNYDVETAIRHFFEGTMPEAIPRYIDPNQHEQSSSTPDNPSSSTNSVRAVLPRYHPIVQLFASFLTFPVRLPLILINILYDYFFGQQSATYNHIFDYIKEVHPNHEEKMRSIFYNQQLQNLRSDIQVNNWKWLVAYIHDSKGSQNFFHSLFDSDFVEKVNSRGAVFFGTVRGSDDASRLRPDRTFGKTRKSCIIIFIIQRNTLKRKLMIEDLFDPVAVSASVDSALIDLIADDADRQAQETMRSEARRLMEEQNREYQESLQRDLERIEKAKTQEAKLKKEQEEEQRKKIESENRKKKVEEYKESLLRNELSNDGNCELLIRYASGKKVIKFNADDNIEKLFDKALHSEMCPLYFQIYQNLPRKAVPCLPEWYYQILDLEELEPKTECASRSCTFREAGITHGGMVYIDSL